MTSIEIGNVSETRTAGRRKWWLVAAGGLLLTGIIASGIVWKQSQPDPSSLLRDGLAAAENGDVAGVHLAIRELQQLKRYGGYVHLIDGALLHKQGNCKQALEHFRWVRPVGESRKPVLLMAGECLYRQGELVSAANCMHQLLELEPNSAEVHRWLAAIDYDTGMMDSALRHLKRVAELDPGDPKPLVMSAVILSDFEQFDEAAKDYRTALKRTTAAGERRQVSIQLAQMLTKLHKYDEAIGVVAGMKPGVGVGGVRAECYLSQGDADRAQQVLDSVGKALSGDENLLMLQARIFLLRGDVEDAVPLLRQSLEIDANNVSARYQLALALKRLGDDEGYLAEIERKQQLEALLNRLTQLSKKAMQSPTDVGTRLEMAQVCDELGRRKMAAVWRKAADVARKLQRNR